jgi:hypothetical protein
MSCFMLAGRHDEATGHFSLFCERPLFKGLFSQLECIYRLCRSGDPKRAMYVFAPTWKQKQFHFPGRPLYYKTSKVVNKKVSFFNNWSAVVIKF